GAGDRPIAVLTDQAGPWLLAALGVGLVGLWVRQFAWGASETSRNESYEVARRLLTQLRTVSRQLSSGLDPVSLADQLLSALPSAIAPLRAGVLGVDPGERFWSIRLVGADAREALDLEDTALT